MIKKFFKAGIQREVSGPLVPVHELHISLLGNHFTKGIQEESQVFTLHEELVDFK